MLHTFTRPYAPFTTSIHCSSSIYFTYVLCISKLQQHLLLYPNTQRKACLLLFYLPYFTRTLLVSPSAMKRSYVCPNQFNNFRSTLLFIFSLATTAMCVTLSLLTLPIRDTHSAYSSPIISITCSSLFLIKLL